MLDEAVLNEMKEVFDRIKQASGGKKVLLFHYLASSVHRTLPPKLLKEIEDLIWDEYVPVICSLPDEDITVETALDVYGIRASEFYQFHENIQYLIAAVSLSDAVITADTATLHIAAGLKKPNSAYFRTYRCRTENFKLSDCNTSCTKLYRTELCLPMHEACNRRTLHRSTN